MASVLQGLITPFSHSFAAFKPINLLISLSLPLPPSLSLSPFACLFSCLIMCISVSPCILCLSLSPPCYASPVYLSVCLCIDMNLCLCLSLSVNLGVFLFLRCLHLTSPTRRSIHTSLPPHRAPSFSPSP